MKKFQLDEETRKKFGSYLKNLRSSTGLTTEAVGELTGIDRSDISRLEAGGRKVINPLYLKELAKLYKVSIFDLQERLGFIDSKTPIHEIKRNENTITLPIYGFASAGKGYINFDEEVKKIVLPKLNNKISKNSFCTIVKGESMEPYYNSGDIIVVNPDFCTEIELLNKKECVIDYDGERYLKRLLFDNGDLILRSYNEAYKDIMVPNERLNEVSCCGVVTMVLDMRV